MADKLDHILRDYFTGKLDVNIKLRKLELSYYNSTDENVGGGMIGQTIKGFTVEFSTVRFDALS